MSLSSLPQFPVPESPPPADAESPETRRLPKSVRILINIGLAAAFVTMVFVTRAEAEKFRRGEAPPVSSAVHAEPWDFKKVEDAYGQIAWGMSRSQIEAILGPPSHPAIWEPAFATKLSWIEHKNRHLGIRTPRIWSRWVDRNDLSKSVTVFFGGDQVYDWDKTGF